MTDNVTKVATAMAKELAATAIETELVTDPAEVAATLLDLGRRFLRANAARHDSEQAVKAASDARDATIGELKAANDAFGEALAEKAGLADVYEGKATVMIRGRVFNVTKSMRVHGSGVAYYVEVVPVVIVG